MPFILILTVMLVILFGGLIPRRELEAVQAEADRLSAEVKALPDPEFWLTTQVEVLDRLPRWMVADFDCPRGPHEWLPRATSRGNHYEWCRHCNRMKRTVDEWPDTQRDPLEVIYDLQFRR